MIVVVVVHFDQVGGSWQNYGTEHRDAKCTQEFGGQVCYYKSPAFSWEKEIVATSPQVLQLFGVSIMNGSCIPEGNHSRAPSDSDSYRAPPGRRPRLEPARGTCATPCKTPLQQLCLGELVMGMMIRGTRWECW